MPLPTVHRQNLARDVIVEAEEDASSGNLLGFFLSPAFTLALKPNPPSPDQDVARDSTEKGYMDSTHTHTNTHAPVLGLGLHQDGTAWWDVHKAVIRAN